MIGLVILYLILGCFMDPMAMMVTTIPIVGPLVASLGYDLVWFGILMVVLSETGMITPPFGINLFVVQAVREKGPALRCHHRRAAIRRGAADTHRAAACCGRPWLCGCPDFSGERSPILR